MTENTLDIQLIYSRDGRHFERIQPGKPWLTTGEPGAWDQYMVNISSKPIQVGNELYVYYGGSKSHHDRWIESLYDSVTSLNKIGHPCWIRVVWIDCKGL